MNAARYAAVVDRARGLFGAAGDALSPLAKKLSVSLPEEGSGIGVWIGRALTIFVLGGLFLLFERLTIVLAAATFVAWLVFRPKAASSQVQPARERREPGRASRIRETVAARQKPEVSSATEENLAEIIPLNNSFAPAWQDVDDFLRATLDIIKTRFTFHTANIFLRGDDRSLLIQRAFVSYTTTVARLAVIKFGHGLVGWVAANKRPMVVGNLRHEGRSMGYYRAAGGGEPIASFAAVPIVVAGEVVGVISLDHTKPDAFASPETEEALLAISGLLARVLGAEEKMELSLREADRFREARRILRAAYEAADLDAAAGAALKQLVTLTDFHALACYLLDEKGEPSRRAAIGFHGILANEVKEPIMLRAINQALSQLSPFRVEGAALAAQYRMVKAAGGAGPEFLIALPILHNGEPIGGLVAELAERKTFDERIEGILTDVVNDMGGAFVRVYKAASAVGAAEVEGELMQFSSGLLRAGSTEEIWERLFTLLVAKTPATAAMAYRRTEKGFILESVAGCSPTENFAPLDEGLLGWTALAGRPVTSSREDRRKPPVEEGESFLAFPIGSSDDEARTPRSVVILAAEEKRAFTAEHMERVREIAQAIEPVIGTLDRLDDAKQRLDQDELTGLFNEPGFRRRLGVMAIGSGVSLVMARIENYAELSNEYGRREIRALLKRVANLLETTVGRRGIVARIEGGAYAIGVKGSAIELKDEIAAALETPAITRCGESDVIHRIAAVSTEENIRLEELLDAAESRLAPSFRRAVGAA